jgi:co-chaperonin GroES (HSP10)
MSAIQMEHDVDPKQTLLKKLGKLDDIEIFNNQILCAVYVRPEKTKGGIVLPDQHRAEDKIQGKVGLVVRKGPSAFVDETNTWFDGVEVDVNDWIVFRPSDGWSITVNGVLCRILDDINVRGRIQHPDHVW